jgi:CTP:molybdopterin cytidylyltransferase MocA
MGSPKALLRTADGSAFVVSIARTLHAAGVSPIVVVAGANDDAVRQALRADDVRDIRVVRNPTPDRGQLSSLLVGMEAVEAGSPPALMMTLVDVPLVTTETVRAVLSAWQASRADVVRPAIGEKHGHPVIFDRRLFAALRSAPLDEGAKAVLRSPGVRIENVPVIDQGCLVDIDTPDDYRRLVQAGEPRRS